MKGTSGPRPLLLFASIIALGGCSNGGAVAVADSAAPPVSIPPTCGPAEYGLDVVPGECAPVVTTLDLSHPDYFVVWGRQYILAQPAAADFVQEGESVEGAVARINREAADQVAAELAEPLADSGLLVGDVIHASDLTLALDGSILSGADVTGVGSGAWSILPGDDPDPNTFFVDGARVVHQGEQVLFTLTSAAGNSGVDWPDARWDSPGYFVVVMPGPVVESSGTFSGNVVYWEVSDVEAPWDYYAVSTLSG